MTTFTISGSNNDTNLILDSANASISESLDQTTFLEYVSYLNSNTDKIYATPLPLSTVASLAGSYRSPNTDPSGNTIPDNNLYHLTIFPNGTMQKTIPGPTVGSMEIPYAVWQDTNLNGETFTIVWTYTISNPKKSNDVRITVDGVSVANIGFQTVEWKFNQDLTTTCYTEVTMGDFTYNNNNNINTTVATYRNYLFNYARPVFPVSVMPDEVLRAAINAQVVLFGPENNPVGLKQIVGSPLYGNRTQAEQDRYAATQSGLPIMNKL